jgi:heterodisulfide reductase subunit B
MTALLYYPGCSMSGTAVGYARSLDAVAEALALDLQEVDDWNCCGANEYFTVGPLQGYALVARNLALAETAVLPEPDAPPADRPSAAARTLVAPCSLCFVNLAKTSHYLRSDPVLAGHVNDALSTAGLACTPGAVEVRHLFEVIVHDVGTDAIQASVRRPLSGLRVAPYLGCLVTRPDTDDRWRDKQHPLAFDRLLESLGATVVDYPLRTECCGGHLSQISPATGLEMIRRLLDGAVRAGADLIATICPMCQMNIDLYQAEVNHRFHTSFHVPILFFTQLMGLAFGHEAGELGIGGEVVSSRKALERIGIEVPVPDGGNGEGAGASPVRQRRPRAERGPALPMPTPVEPEVDRP